MVVAYLSIFGSRPNSYASVLMAFHIIWEVTMDENFAKIEGNFKVLRLWKIEMYEIGKNIRNLRNIRNLT